MLGGTAVLTRARAELRARIKPMLALTLLVGIGGAAVMALAAGARRTDTAYPRFARAYKAADMLVYPSFDPTFANLDFNAVSKFPEVAAAADQPFVFAQGNYGISIDTPPFGTAIDRTKVLEGRMPNDTATNEAAIPYWFAKEKHWHLGSTITISFGTNNNSFFPMVFHIVGIEASPGEFPPLIGQNGPNSGGGTVHISQAAYKALLAKDVFSLKFLLLRFKHGAADNARVNDRLNAMAHDEKGKPLVQLNDNLNEQAANVQRSIHLQAVALWLVAGLAALIIVLVLTQLLARQATIDSTENPTLLALGMSRTEVWLTGMARALIIGVAGAAIGAGIAYALSGLMPIGVARIAEPNPGLDFDPLLLGLGAAGVVVLVLAMAAWPIWKNARLVQKEVRRSSKPGLAARAAATPGLSPAVGTGLRHALESGRGRTEVPVRSSLLSVILAIVALAGALTFGASLDHLISTPRLYGWNWDYHFTTDGAPNDDAADALLKSDPRVLDLANIDTPPVLVNGGKRVDAIALSQIKGQIEPVIIEGHTPELPNEVGLGVKTMKEAHTKVGGTVRLKVSAISDSIEQTYKVVASVVLPANSDTTRLGTGVIMTEEGVKLMAPPGFQIPAPSDMYMNFAPGVDKKAALADILKKKVTYVDQGDSVSSTDSFSSPPHLEPKTTTFDNAYGLTPQAKPTDLVNFGNVQNLPLLLAGLVALLAAATLAHTLVTSIRRRRRDLAILKMLGFVPGQVRIAVAPWQATTFVATALLIGIPVGIAVGRVVWTVFATNLGTKPEPVTPSLRLLIAAAGAIVLANLIAIAPAFVAGRMRPAPALRAE